MTFTIGSDILEFPLLFSNGNLYVGAPAQAVTTHNAQTLYTATTSYPCGTGTVVTPVVEKGSVIFWSNIKNIDNRVYGAVRISYTAYATKQQISIDKYTASSPGCGVPSTPQATLEPGTYNYSAEWQFYNAYGQLTTSNRSGSFTITSKGCVSVEIK